MTDLWEPYLCSQNGGFPKIRGTCLGGPYNKDYNIMRFILGSPILGNYHRGLEALGFEPSSSEGILKVSWFRE